MVFANIITSFSLSLGVVHSCQHYHKCTQSTHFCDPLPPSQKSTLKMLILPTPNENAMLHNQHFKKRTVAIDPLPQRTLFTLLKLMMTIQDDPLHPFLSPCCSIFSTAGRENLPAQIFDSNLPDSSLPPWLRFWQDIHS